MKFNWRVLVALVVMVGVIVWTVNSVRSRSYSGTNLAFLTGQGAVTVINPSASPVAAQLTSAGSQQFSLTGSSPGLKGNSAPQGTGSNITQSFDLSLLPGPNVFTITRVTGVSFAGSADTSLQATIEPLTPDNVRDTLLFAIIVLLGGLFYISRSTHHSWINLLRRTPEPILAPAPVVETPVGDPNRGRDGRMYSNYGSKD